MSTCELPKILNLLPDGFQSDDMIVGASEILHQLISSFEKDKALETIVPDEIRSVLKGQNYTDKGVMNWFSYYQPYLGSDKFLEYLFKLSKVNTEIIPWYETNNPTNTFDLILDKFPSGVDLPSLLKLINTYKNIESKLASVRMADCPIRLTLDNSRLDYDILSDTAGYSIEGTTFCFRNVHYEFDLVFPTFTHKQFKTKNRLEFVKFPFHETLDNTILGEKNIILEPRTQRQVLYTEIVTPLVIEPTDENKWYTFGNQMVLSDYGTLSGGEGFVGSYLESADNTLDSMILDDAVQVRIPILSFNWANHTYHTIVTAFSNIKITNPVRDRIIEVTVDISKGYSLHELKTTEETYTGRLEETWMTGEWDAITTWSTEYSPVVASNHYKVLI